MNNDKPTTVHNGDGADFSNYMKSNAATPPAQGHPNIQEHTPGIKVSKRVKILVGILLGLVVIQAIILYLGWKPQPEQPVPNIILNNGQAK